MKFLEEEEALRARANLEKELRQDPLEPTTEPTPEELKNYLEEAYYNINHILEYYMDLSEDTRNIVALWTIGTYFHPNYNTYPYLFINAMRGSGKTRLLKIIEAFAHNAQLTTLLTDAVMFRTTGTLLLDEFEGVNRKGSETLKELLNSAYKKGTKVFRMKKKKTMEGESQIVEEFQPYRPIVMANIWGMEEVLGDRCISLLLEKSMDKSKIKLIETFGDMEIVKHTKVLLNRSKNVVSCSVVTSRNVHLQWNEYVKRQYTTPSTLHTFTTYNYTKLHEKEIEANKVEQMLKGEDFLIKDYEKLFKKIDETKIDGRYLELFFPLFMIASQISEELLNKTLNYSQKLVSDKRVDEITESKDVLVYSLVAKEDSTSWKEVSSLTSIFRMMVGEGENDWLNAKWVGRALKRLNLIKEKKRTSTGMVVILDVEKAKEKERMFK